MRVHMLVALSLVASTVEAAKRTNCETPSLPAVFASQPVTLRADQRSKLLATAAEIVPVDGHGHVASNGSVGLLTIGPSYTRQWSIALGNELAKGKKAGKINPQLVFVNGAANGYVAEEWADPGCPCWAALEQTVRASGLQLEQVAAVIISVNNAATDRATFDRAVNAQLFHVSMHAIINEVRARFIGVRVAYVSHGHYGGCSTKATRDAEPFGFDEDMQLQAIQDQYPSMAPGSSDGFVVVAKRKWTNGVLGRSWDAAEGLPSLFLLSEHITADGVHFTQKGRAVYGKHWYADLLRDPAAQGWLAR